MLKVIDPTNNKLVREYQEHTDQEVRDRIQQVSNTFQKWSRYSFQDRSVCMYKLAELLKSEVDSIAKIMTTEMGKPIKEARREVLKCSSGCEYYAEHSADFLKDEPVETKGKRSFITFDPLGVILCIMPWNYPLWQVVRFAAPALMAGNGVLLKHAPNVPGCALAFETLIEKAGFPKGIFRSLLISNERTSSVIEDERVAAVTLTGSEKAGVSVATSSAKVLKKAVLELGGSDPFIVLEDAPWEKCTEMAITARLQNCGQSCIAAKRFIVIDTVVERFCKNLKERIAKLKIGDPLLEDTNIGPLAREDLLQNLERQINVSLQKGAQLQYGGKRLEREGFFYQPTIMTGIKPGMPVYDEETFGPVFAIISVRDTEEAISIANDSHYGLGASVWSDNVELAEQIARKLQTGSVYVNSQMVSDPRLPFGGIKRSGYGRELSQYGIKEFVNIKTICIV